MSEFIKELTIENFEETALAEGVTVVDFWAPRCPPCRMLTPVLEEVAAEIAGRASICKINVDEEMEPAVAYDVQVIPTLIRFEDGMETARLVGLQSKEQLLLFIGV